MDPHQMNDDLDYYENTLPKVIAAVRRGEKWEYRDGITWSEARYQSLFNLKEFLIYHPTCRVRLAPVPVVKWWDSGADIPAGPVYVRPKLQPDVAWLIVGIGPEGIAYSQASRATWDYIKQVEMQHSTDLRNWSDCVKPEGGK